MPDQSFSEQFIDSRNCHQNTSKTISVSDDITLRDFLIDHLRANGIEVITDRTEGQTILDEYNKGIGRDLNVQLGWSEKEAEAREALNYLNSHDIHVPERGRYLYTVDIPDDNGKNFLYWDGSLTSRQAETIRESLYKAVLERNDDYKGSEKFLAQELSVIKEGSHIGDTYGTISDYLGSDKVASEFLSGLGYTGIKVHTDHFGNDSRYKDDWNYVIFNEKDLGIKDKIKFFKAANGDAFGFTVNNKIYVDPKIANS